MKSRWILALSVLVVSTSVFAADISYKKGETWTYEVKGPRPWTTDTIYGDRTVSVNSSGESGWTVEDEWGTYDENPHLITVNKDGYQTKLQVNDNFSIDFSTPVPFNMVDLIEVGKEKDYGKFERKSDLGSMSLSTHVKREKDEDITVPAGDYKACQKYFLTNVISINSQQNEMKRKSTRYIWVHPKANGIVKEVYSVQPLGGNSEGTEKTTVELKKHDVKSE